MTDPLQADAELMRLEEKLNKMTDPCEEEDQLIRLKERHEKEILGPIKKELDKKAAKLMNQWPKENQQDILRYRQLCDVEAIQAGKKPPHSLEWYKILEELWKRREDRDEAERGDEGLEEGASEFELPGEKSPTEAYLRRSGSPIEEIIAAMPEDRQFHARAVKEDLATRNGKPASVDEFCYAVGIMSKRELEESMQLEQTLIERSEEMREILDRLTGKNGDEDWEMAMYRLANESVMLISD